MTAAFDAVYRQLRGLMLDAAAGHMAAKDAPGDLVVHGPRIDPKTGKAEWFGAVTIKKSYVAYHLMPLYTDPALGDGMSAALLQRRQGKSCFNFKVAEPELFAELAALTRRAAGQGT
jgi:hypothetical protein